MTDYAAALELERTTMEVVCVAVDLLVILARYEKLPWDVVVARDLLSQALEARKDAAKATLPLPMHAVLAAAEEASQQPQRGWFMQYWDEHGDAVYVDSNFQRINGPARNLRDLPGA